MITRKSFWLFTGFLISGLCLWLFLKNIEWDKLLLSLREANYIYVFPSLGAMMVCYLLRALRWGSLVSPVKRASFINLFSAVSIGFMGNHLLPARAGEFIRSVLLGKKENISISTVIATVVMERLLDSISMIILATVVLSILPISIDPQGSATSAGSPSLQDIRNSTFLHQMKSGIGILGGVCLVTVVSLILLDLYSQRAISLVEKLLFFIPHGLRDTLLGLLGSFIHGLKVLRNIKQVLWLSILSFAIWLSGILSAYILAYSFHIEIPFSAMCLVGVGIGLAVALPQAPGYIGVYHLAVQKTLELFHVDLSSAQSFAIVSWTINILVPIIIGTFFLWREGMSFGQLIERKATTEELVKEGS
ncbi:MAG: lysylphosphatidylglycerol synthase transmembrane domain-containing protein [Candidatus Brocadiales bacterium]|nr:lysylphosphatidylglycerol synthase transmembrane domain-containing protein [Candidatus Brocadiales bacterium]